MQESAVMIDEEYYEEDGDLQDMIQGNDREAPPDNESSLCSFTKLTDEELLIQVMGMDPEGKFYRKSVIEGLEVDEYHHVGGFIISRAIDPETGEEMHCIRKMVLADYEAIYEGKDR
jgi:hypothetical protein